MKSFFGVLTIACFFATPAIAKKERGAAPDKVPVEQSNARTNEFKFDTYHAGIQIVRERTPGKTFATFIAEPQLIEAGAQLVFEVRSVAKSGSVLRWRCVAENDVAQCLGAPLKVRYLPKDTKIVLTAQLVPKPKPALDRAVAAR